MNPPLLLTPPPPSQEHIYRNKDKNWNKIDIQLVIIWIQKNKNTHRNQANSKKSFIAPVSFKKGVTLQQRPDTYLGGAGVECVLQMRDCCIERPGVTDVRFLRTVKLMTGESRSLCRYFSLIVNCMQVP